MNCYKTVINCYKLELICGTSGGDPSARSWSQQPAAQAGPWPAPWGRARTPAPGLAIYSNL